VIARAVLAVAAGGALGSVARWTVAEALPHAPGSMPWSTLTVNVTGALLLGILVGVVTTVWSHTALLRPFLGTGVLGGYTTFSTAMVDLRHLLPSLGLAVAYVALTLGLGLAAAALGDGLGRAAGGRTHPRAEP